MMSHPLNDPEHSIPNMPQGPRSSFSKEAPGQTTLVTPSLYSTPFNKPIPGLATLDTLGAGVIWALILLDALAVQILDPHTCEHAWMLASLQLFLAGIVTVVGMYFQFRRKLLIDGAVGHLRFLVQTLWWGTFFTVVFVGGFFFLDMFVGEWISCLGGTFLGDLGQFAAGLLMLGMPLLGIGAFFYLVARYNFSGFIW